MTSHRFASLLLLLSTLPAVAQFTEIASPLPKPPFACVAWGDYDGDGDLDVLVAGEGKQNTSFSTIYRNTAGVFADSGVALLGLGRAVAAWGDFDNDGDLDLAMSGEKTGGGLATRIYRNNGGTFALVPGNFVAVYGGNVAWGDIDNDGDLDLLVTGVLSASPGSAANTQLYRNDAGVFTAVAHPFPNCYLGSAAWGDYDHDGDQDLILAGTLTNGLLVTGLWRNDGGTFTDTGADIPGADLGYAAWGDYDGDGDLDLLYGGIPAWAGSRASIGMTPALSRMRMRECSASSGRRARGATTIMTAISTRCSSATIRWRR